jgi:major membrane immunogen (membrane-anchored lipoprotein)
LGGVPELSFTREFVPKHLQIEPTLLDHRENNMKTKLGIVVVACAALFLSSCGSSPENLILGKWEAGEGNFKITAEFGKDAKAKLTVLGQTVQGTYKVNGGDELEWTVNGITTKSKVKLTKTEMELTSEGKTIKYKKV